MKSLCILCVHASSLDKFKLHGALLLVAFRPKNGKFSEKFIKFLNFCQIRLEPPGNENQKVPLAKGGASPLMPPRSKNIIILKMAEKN